MPPFGGLDDADDEEDDMLGGDDDEGEDQGNGSQVMHDALPPRCWKFQRDICAATLPYHHRLPCMCLLMTAQAGARGGKRGRTLRRSVQARGACA